MSEIRQPSGPRGESPTKRRRRESDSKNNTVQATGFALGSTALNFWTMFSYEVHSYRCGTRRERLDTICEPLGMTVADFVNMLLYVGIVLGVVSVVMTVLAFFMKLPDYPRWTVHLFRTIFLIVTIMGWFFARN